MGVIRNRGADPASAATGAPPNAARSDALRHAARPHRTLWRDAFSRLIANRLALFGMIVILAIVFMAVFAPLIAPYDYRDQHLGSTFQSPSSEWWMGTDNVGRDMFSRMIYGARVSMLVGLGAQVIILAIALPIGIIAGYSGGRVDNLLMRLVDVMYAFPQLLFVILIMAMLGRGLQNIFLAIGITGWVILARVVRAEFLSLREKDYVVSAHAAGAGSWRIAMKHILPNALTPIIVTITFGVPLAIFTEAALSFVGVGISPPMPSWGGMVGDNQTYINSYWFLSLFPALAIALVMMSFTFFGDGLRDALDPRSGRR
ncbi:MAG: ABC transporter permease [Sphaerobacteraceae bacterium]|nr:MAG: ABC transporter permease [Sphaerobacteraceae bacterium]